MTDKISDSGRIFHTILLQGLILSNTFQIELWSSHRVGGDTRNVGGAMYGLGGVVYGVGGTAHHSSPVIGRHLPHI